MCCLMCCLNFKCFRKMSKTQIKFSCKILECKILDVELKFEMKTRIKNKEKSENRHKIRK